MPITPIPKALYPLVPQAPGVPALLRSGAQILDAATLGYLGIGDALNSIIGQEPIQWGIFDDTGKPLADYDSFVATEYSNESDLSNYPVEKGAFATYNKVENPFQVQVTLTCGGEQTRRANFVAKIEAARKSLTLYTVVTPEYSHTNCNIVGLAIRRDLADGAYTVNAMLSLREVRQTAAIGFSTPQQPSGYDPRAQGQIQIISDPTFDASGVA